MRDSRVDDYLATLPAWQREAAQRVRLLLHEADPELSETIKRTRQPYFVLDGNVAAFLGTKNHLDVFIYDPIAPDPTGLINQGHGNATARSIQMSPAVTMTTSSASTSLMIVGAPAAGTSSGLNVATWTSPADVTETPR